MSNISKWMREAFCKKPHPRWRIDVNTYEDRTIYMVRQVDQNGFSSSASVGAWDTFAEAEDFIRENFDFPIYYKERP